MTAIAIAPQAAQNGATLRDVAEQFSAEHETKLAALTNRVQLYKRAKMDAVTDTRALRAIVVKPSDENLPPQLALAVPQNGLAMTIGDVAHGQLSQRLKIDLPYYKRMVAEAPELLAQNLNWWMEHKPEERMLRMLRVEALSAEQQKAAGSIGARLFLRGVLGKGYRTIDDADLIAEALPRIVANGGLLRDFSIDERRLYAKFATPARDVKQIIAEARSRGRFTQHVIGEVSEVISSGVVIRHSEVGFASLSASVYDELLRCLNGMVGVNEISIRHVGSKNQGEGDGDVRYLSDETTLLENAALLSKVGDAIDRSFQIEPVAERMVKLLNAKQEVVKLPDVPLFEFVGNVGAALDLNLDQIETLKAETLKSQLEEGGSVAGQATKFSFVQGITATARQMTNYDKRYEIEQAGFRLLQDDHSALLKLAREGAKARKN
jgi:hypothetical protein